MMPITEEVHAFLTANAAAQIQRDDEYLDPADGLLHCKTCHGLSSEGLHTNQAFATAIVLLIIVVGINALAGLIAKKVRHS